MLKGRTVKDQVRSWGQHKQTKASQVLLGRASGDDVAERARELFRATVHRLDEMQLLLLSEHNIAYDWGENSIRLYDDKRGRLLAVDAETNSVFDPETCEIVDAVSVGWDLPPRPTAAQRTAYTAKHQRLVLFSQIQQCYYAMLDCGNNARDEGRTFEEGILEGIDIYWQEDFPRQIVAEEALLSRERGVSVLAAWVAANTTLPAKKDLTRFLSREHGNAFEGLLAELPLETATHLHRWLDGAGDVPLDLPAIRRKSTTAITNSLREVEGTGNEVSLEMAEDVGEDILSRVMMAETAEEALGSLTERQRTVVQMNADGYTDAEIAAQIERSIGTVKATISQAREKMNTPLANRKKKGRPKK